MGTSSPDEPQPGSRPGARFVILEHRWRGVHWDVMLEDGDALRTWAVDEEILAGREIPARRLPDHRLAYLVYEGPVSGDRGEVQRADDGTYRAVEWSEGRIVVDLSGDQLRGRLMLTLDGGGGWSLRFAPGNVA